MKYIAEILAIIVILLLVGRLHHHAPTPMPKPMPTPVPPPLPQPVDPIEVMKRNLLDCHNRERSRRGISPLSRNAALERAAQKHTDWMVARSNLTHNEPGHNLEKRVDEQGYDWTWLGENIADGQRDVQEVMTGWMDSSGHRANILNGHFKDIGFGIDKDNKGNWWWTADFASHQE